MSVVLSVRMWALRGKLREYWLILAEGASLVAATHLRSGLTQGAAAKQLPSSGSFSVSHSRLRLALAGP